MKVSRLVRYAIFGGLGLIIVAVVILLVLIPSRSDLASNPTATLPPIVFPTLTRPARPTSAPTNTSTSAPANTPTSAPTIAPTSTATNTPIATPTQAVVAVPFTQGSPYPTATLPLGFHLLYMTPVMITGTTGQVTISTAPGASCTITVMDSRANISQVPGLEAKTAGVDGMCTWIWTVTHTDFPGTGYVKINSNGMMQTFIYTFNSPPIR